MTAGDTVRADKLPATENSSVESEEAIEEIDRGKLPGLSENDSPSAGQSKKGGETPGAEEVDMSRMKPGIGTRVRSLFSNPFSKP